MNDYYNKNLTENISSILNEVDENHKRKGLIKTSESFVKSIVLFKVKKISQIY